MLWTVSFNVTANFYILSLRFTMPLLQLWCSEGYSTLHSPQSSPGSFQFTRSASRPGLICCNVSFITTFMLNATFALHFFIHINSDKRAVSPHPFPFARCGSVTSVVKRSSTLNSSSSVKLRVSCQLQNENGYNIISNCNISLWFYLKHSTRYHFQLQYRKMVTIPNEIKRWHSIMFSSVPIGAPDKKISFVVPL